MKTLLSLLKSKTIESEKDSFIENAIDAFIKDPVAIIKFLEEIKSFPSRLRDAIYWKNFATYIFHLYDYDEENSTIVNKYKKNVSEMLAEDSPNQDHNMMVILCSGQAKKSHVSPVGKSQF